MQQSREQQFLRDVENHSLEILHDQGLYRHLRFNSADVTANYFEIMTWENHLSLTGEAGSFVFSAKKDMFAFFRRGDGGITINPAYCSDKLISIDQNIKFRHFDPQKFIDQVTLQFILWSDQNNDLAEPTIKAVWDEIETKVIAAVAEGQAQAYQAVKNFQHDAFQFEELLEVNTYTHNAKYLWCLYAICWGIQQYDNKQQFGNNQKSDNKLQIISPDKISDVRALLAEY